MILVQTIPSKEYLGRPRAMRGLCAFSRVQTKRCQLTLIETGIISNNFWVFGKVAWYAGLNA